MSQSGADGVFGFEFYEYENRNSTHFLRNDLVIDFLSLKGTNKMKFVTPLSIACLYSNMQVRGKF
jgi:hypothetical protein